MKAEYPLLVLSSAVVELVFYVVIIECIFFIKQYLNFYFVKSAKLVLKSSRDLVALTGFIRYFICRVVLKKLTSSTFVSYCFTILSYISIKSSAHVLS